MGYILKATCKNCQFEKELSFGRGMGFSSPFDIGIPEFSSVCLVPAMNKRTRVLGSKNIYENIALNATYLFYNATEMYQGNIKEGYIETDNVKIKKSNNLCPKCNSYILEFQEFGFFD